MFRRRLPLLVTLIFVLVVFMNVGRAEAAEFRGGADVTIGLGEVIDDDVYAAGGYVTVRGTINGDLVASGANVNVDGTVNGDVITVAGTVNVTGTVKDDVRAAGGQINVYSLVGGDVIVGGGSVVIGSDAVVGNDLVVGGGVLDMRGLVKGNAKVGVDEAMIDGVILGDLNADIGQRLRLGPDTRIDGSLTYKSVGDAQIDPAAQVVGEITRTTPTTSVLGIDVQDSLGVRALNSVIAQARWFIGIALVGGLLLWLFPGVMAGVTGSPTRSPWKCLGLGLAVMIVAPIVTIAVAVIAMIFGGFAAVPVLLIPGAAYIALLTLAAPIIAIVMGRMILNRLLPDRTNPLWQQLLLGAAMLAIIGFVPYLNAGVAVLTLLLGFGAWILYLSRKFTESRQAFAA